MKISKKLLVFLMFTSLAGTLATGDLYSRDRDRRSRHEAASPDRARHAHWCQEHPQECRRRRHHQEVKQEGREQKRSLCRKNPEKCRGYHAWCDKNPEPCRERRAKQPLFDAYFD